jgi:hypothetical protein
MGTPGYNCDESGYTYCLSPPLQFFLSFPDKFVLVGVSKQEDTSMSTAGFRVHRQSPYNLITVFAALLLFDVYN